jgi:outer membrane protein assembly factor BamB
MSWSRPFLAFVFLASIAGPLRANDWPQWRGMQRDGVSQEGGLLKEWPSEGPKLVWQVKEIGTGYSTPAVVGERLYLISNQGLDNEFAQCLSTRDGKQIWSTKLGEVGPNEGPQYPGSRSTPTIEGGMAYCLGSNGDLACLEAATGKVVWKKSLRQDFGGKTGKWAYAESPLIDGDTLVCTPGGAEATLVALNKKSGATLWKSALPEADEAAYASVIVVQAGGVKQYVQMLQKGLAGVEAKTGKLLWRYENTVKGSPANIPTPVAQDALVYSSTGRGGAGLVQLKASGTAVAAEEVYFTPKLPNAIGGSVLVGGQLYGTNNQGLICADFATGDVKWQDRSVGAGSLCFADGRLYLHGENGEVALVEATSAGYREKGRFTPPDQPANRTGKAWAYPVVANGRLYIHDFGCLWCYDIKAK